LGRFATLLLTPENEAEAPEAIVTPQTTETVPQEAQEATANGFEIPMLYSIVFFIPTVTAFPDGNDALVHPKLLRNAPVIYVSLVFEVDSKRLIAVGISRPWHITTTALLMFVFVLQKSTSRKIESAAHRFKHTKKTAHEGGGLIDNAPARCYNLIVKALPVNGQPRMNS